MDTTTRRSHHLDESSSTPKDLFIENTRPTRLTTPEDKRDRCDYDPFKAGNPAMDLMRSSMYAACVLALPRAPCAGAFRPRLTVTARRASVFRPDLAKGTHTGVTSKAKTAKDGERHNSKAGQRVADGLPAAEHDDKGHSDDEA